MMTFVECNGSYVYPNRRSGRVRKKASNPTRVLVRAHTRDRAVRVKFLRIDFEKNPLFEHTAYNFGEYLKIPSYFTF